MIIKKRNGSLAPFDVAKMVHAIKAANDEVKGSMTLQEIEDICHQIEEYYEDKNEVTVEHISDAIEDVLQLHNKPVAKAFIRYRQTHKDRRELRDEAKKHLVETYKQIFFGDAKDSDLRRDNANINTDAPMGQMLKMGTESSKFFVDNFELDTEAALADKEDWIHIHDKDFSLITFNCCQIDLGKLLKGGFSTGHGFLREPNSIRAAAALACIAIQSNQNDMFGGQSINAWDFSLAPYVRKSYRRAVKKLLTRYVKYQLGVAGFDKTIFDEIAEKTSYGMAPAEFQKIAYKPFVNNPSFAFFMEDDEENFEIKLQFVYNDICAEVEDEVKQAMEAAIHNFNSLHSRAGSQVPFSSINYGLDISPEGRLITKMTLEAINDGLGHGETPIFPISVFQLKAGVNYNPGDPNYDMFKRACEVSAKRLFPNFVNIDAPYNLQYYKPGDYNSTVSTMGCRTRVMSNINGPEESGSRGNFSFTTLNLPMLALEAKKLAPDHAIDKFFELMDKYTLISKTYLEKRYEFIASKHVYNFPFLMGQGVWMDSDKLKPTDEIRKVLQHASISIGFCGLAECLVALTDSHHGASEDAQALGLKIVGHLREMTDKFTDETGMNWSCFGTPAESTAGQFLRATRKKFGVIEGVTDRDYFTNSSHVPVYYPIKAFKKIQIEAPYHALENAGHIAYVEMDGDPTKNVAAFEKLVRAMHDADMGYFSINHPVDRDPVCGYTGIIENECPHCHRKEATKVNTIEHVERVK